MGKNKKKKTNGGVAPSQEWPRPGSAGAASTRPPPARMRQAGVSTAALTDIGSVGWKCIVIDMNLKEWASKRGVGYTTALKWFREGELPVPSRKIGGLILVDADERGMPLGEARVTEERSVVYARVSSSDQRGDLDRQVARVTAWATTQGIAVDEVVTEVGSALNGHRRKFKRLLEDATATRILVEHRDRFCRFGVEYIEAALSAQDRQIVVLDPAEVDDDLVRDMTELMTSMSARLYGKRSAQNRARAAIAAAGGEHPDDA